MSVDTLLLVVFPYVAVVVFVLGVWSRMRDRGFQVSSLSSQFLEGRKLFWGSVPFHFGLIVLFFGHLSAFLLPKATLAWNAIPARLIVLEVTAFIFGLSVLVGLAQLIVRRISDPRIRVVTSRMDFAIEFVLLAQVILGCWIALGYRWGSSWFASDLSPYLWSLVKLGPDTSAVFALPWVVKLHIFGAFLVLFMVPFTRLVHFVAAPLHYIARPYQQVLWHWDPKKVRSTSTPWSIHRPKNT